MKIFIDLFNYHDIQSLTPQNNFIPCCYCSSIVNSFMQLQYFIFVEMHALLFFSNIFSFVNLYIKVTRFWKLLAD